MKSEQRSATRQQVSGTHVSVVDVESGVEFDAAAQDLSNAGLRFFSELEPPVGADMHVTVRGDRSLRAMMRVLRVTKAPRGFEVAGVLSRVA